MVKKNILVCIDRDGTLIEDHKYFLGSQKDWKKKIHFLSSIISGIKLLRAKIPGVKIYMISNQSGIAIKNFPLLTKKKANIVCKEVLRLLKIKSAKLDGYEICEHVSPKYVKSHKQYEFYKKLVCNCSCIKPKAGMINSILKKEKFKAKNTEIYVIGDRLSDIKAGLNAKGFGILVPFKGEPQEVKKVDLKKSKNIRISKNLTEAAKLIVKNSKKNV